MRHLLAIAFTLGFSTLANGQAASPLPPAPDVGENGRYSMTPAGNGFLRLDTRTGAVSLCSVVNASAECRAAADDRAALMYEIDRLTRLNAENGKAAPRSVLPNKDEMDRSLDFAEQFMRRMMRVMRDENGASK